METRMDYISARGLLLSRARPVGTETVPLTASFGRVLARGLRAAEDVPAFDRSPYDGYALRAADTAGACADAPVTLRILEEIPAGAVPTRTVAAGTASKVLTGAPIPPGADAVINFEATRFTAETVTLSAPLAPGKNIVRRGEDVRCGALLAAPGTVIDAGLCGTLAAQGVAAPEVFRVPRVAVFSTGSELVEPDADVRPGCIRNTNAYSLCAALRAAGLEPVYLGTAGDDVGAIAALLESGLRSCDAVVCSGGVSVGDYDLTPDAMERCGVEMLLRGVALKPGMACAYGVREGKIVCALSGNPASSLINLYTVALPALKTLAGRADAVPAEITLTLRDGFPKKSGSTRILRGRLALERGRAELVLPGDQGNVVLSSTVGSNALAVIPAGSGPVPAGTELKGFLI